jgi:hypothetical protein
MKINICFRSGWLLNGIVSVDTIQGVPGGKVSILGGHIMGH